MRSWLKMSAVELGKGIGEGEIEPLDLTQVYLNEIDTNPMTDRIYARVTRERALAEAAAAQARSEAGHRLSLLDGVPLSWKDLFDSNGAATEAGSKLLKDRVPDRDAAVLENATALGTVCLGKTHMSELAFSGLGYNPSTATSPCINNPDAVAGGSSSGAAASVAHDLAVAGIGSDTGGSVRIPAAWNDLVGLKTTAGRVSLEGVVPLCLKFDTIGPLTRSVADAAAVLAIMEGRKPADMEGATLKGRRFAVLKTVALDEVRDEPLEGFETAVAELKDAGVEIETIEVDAVAEAMPLSSTLFTTEAYGLWRDVIEANPDLMFGEILERFRIGSAASGADYVAAWAKLEAARVAYDAAVAKYDAVLCPTSPILPPDLERLKSDHDYYVTENLLALRNTRIANLLGLCALTLPTGTPSCGISLMAPPETEENLLRLGAAVEAALA